MEQKRITGILVRNPKAVHMDLQDILSSYGCSIRTRLGLGRIDEQNGLILLEMKGDTFEWHNMERKLNNLDGVEVQHIDF